MYAIITIISGINKYFFPLFGLLQISRLVLSLYGRCCHTVTKLIMYLIGGRAKSQMAKEVTTGDWERNQTEKHLSFLQPRQGARSLPASAQYANLLSLGALFTVLQI